MLQTVLTVIIAGAGILLIVASVINGDNANMVGQTFIGGSRAMYSMAESYMIPKFFAKLHPKYKTPVNALILIGAVTMIAPLAGRKMLVWISDAGNFGCCMAYCMVAMYCIPGSGATLVAQEWVAVGSWCLLGVVFYAVCKRKYKENFGMLVEIISDEDAATLMPEADDAELDKVIDEAIERVLKKYAA